MTHPSDPAPSAEPNPTPDSSPDLQSPAQRQTGHCHHCQAENSDKARFCGKCGHSLNHADIKTDLSGAIDDMSPAVRKPLWHWMASAIKLWVLLLVLSGLFGIYIKLSGSHTPWMDLIYELISAVVILVALVQSWPLLHTKLKKNEIPIPLMGRDIFIGLIAIYVFMNLYFRLLGMMGIESISYLEHFQSQGWSFFSVIIMICIMPGIFEELAFRGVIMARLEKVSKPREALIIQALMFSFLHLIPAVFISHFFIGLVLGIIRNRTRSLYPGMLLHALWNFIVILEEHFRIGGLT